MSRLLTLFVSAVILIPAQASSPDPKDLTIPPDENARAQNLIRRLGSEVYREREEAHTELAKMGRLARPALLVAAAVDPDPEIRFRCSRLLPKAGADDLKARLDTFLADTECKYEHELPGIKKYRQVVGTDKAARDLFVEIFKSPHNIDLLQALDKSTAEAGRAVSDRRMVLWAIISQRNNINGRIQPQQSIPFSDIVCLIFAETLVPAKEIPRNMWNSITGATFLQQQGTVLDGLNANTSALPYADACKRLLAHWIETRVDPMDLNQMSFLAARLPSFKEIEPMLRRTVSTDGVYGYAKGQALMALVRNRPKEEMPYLRSLLGNDTVVTPVAQHICLLRDVALAMLILHSDQKMASYGYIFLGNAEPNKINIGFGNYAFPSEEARAAAFVKYGFWRMKHGGKDPEPAKTEPKQK